MSNPYRLAAGVAALLLVAACHKQDEEAATTPQLVAAPLTMTVGAGLASLNGSDAGIESCATAALAQAPGKLLRARLKSEPDGRRWAFAIRQADGRRQDIECSDSAGTLVDTEVPVASAADPAFAAIARIDVAAAQAIALETKPGTVASVAFALAGDGLARYAFELATADGAYRIEVDAASGELAEVSRTLLEIGGD